MEASVDLNLSIDGLDEVKRLSDELNRSMEKTKALANALIKACNQVTINIDQEHHQLTVGAVPSRQTSNGG